MGLNTYSNCNIHGSFVEHLTSTTGVESNLIFDFDFLDHDQINHPNEVYSLMQLNSEMQIPRNCLLKLKFHYSIWQPPKIS
jgi:hypothetical protein